MTTFLRCRKKSSNKTCFRTWTRVELKDIFRGIYTIPAVIRLMKLLQLVCWKCAKLKILQCAFVFYNRSHRPSTLAALQIPSQSHCPLFVLLYLNDRCNFLYHCHSFAQVHYNSRVNLKKIETKTPTFQVNASNFPWWLLWRGTIFIFFAFFKRFIPQTQFNWTWVDVLLSLFIYQTSPASATCFAGLEQANYSWSSADRQH